MRKQPILNQGAVSDASYKVGEECNYWLKFGEYTHQQAIEDGWLDAQGKLTLAGLQAIISEQERAKRREDLVRAFKCKGGNLKGKFQTNKLRLKASSSSPGRKVGVSSTLKSRQHTKSAFIDEAKILLSKINGKFAHFSDDDAGYHLVVRIPNEKKGSTSHTFRGALSDIRRELYNLAKEVEEKNR